MIGNVSRARLAAGRKTYPVLFIVGEYGFACKVLGSVGEKLAVVLLHDDCTSSHYRIMIDGNSVRTTRDDARDSWQEVRAERKAQRQSARAARDEYRAARESLRSSRRLAIA